MERVRQVVEMVVRSRGERNERMWSISSDGRDVMKFFSLVFFASIGSISRVLGLTATCEVEQGFVLLGEYNDMWEQEILTCVWKRNKRMHTM